MPCMLAWSTCPRANEPNACQLLILDANVPINVPNCQRCANYLTWPANVSTSSAKRRTIFELLFRRIFQFLNFLIMLNIWKFQECLGNSRNPNSRNKVFKFWHLQNFIKEKPCQPKSFDVVFDGARGINQTIIRLV